MGRWGKRGKERERKRDGALTPSWLNKPPTPTPMKGILRGLSPLAQHRTAQRTRPQLRPAQTALLFGTGPQQAAPSVPLHLSRLKPTDQRLSSSPISPLIFSISTSASNTPTAGHFRTAASFSLSLSHSRPVSLSLSLTHCQSLSLSLSLNHCVFVFLSPP